MDTFSDFTAPDGGPSHCIPLRSLIGLLEADIDREFQPEQASESRDVFRWRLPVSQAHWCQIWSTNPLDRVNKEIKRRTAVVGVLPQPRGPAAPSGRGAGPAAR